MCTGFKNILVLFAAILFFCLNTVAQGHDKISITEPGKYVLGCNYWASHAGTNMWKDWRPDIVEADFKQISEAGMQVIRVFPIWPDFQPIVQFYSSGGSLKEIRFKNGPLPETGPGKDGISEEALAHFRVLADLAEKYNIKLLVGLVTGWMSGQLFVPQALDGRKILSDPTSIMWQVKLVRNMVHEFKNHPAILAWDLGNECNVMENVENSQSAYVWTASVTNAIRAEDPDHPIVSGMDGLSSDSHAVWRIQDQAELTDLLTTHPYPFWTAHANQDQSNTIRTILHSSAETRFYGDIGGKPCMVEETGIMGPMEANELTKAGFLRSILFNNWANDCHGLLWWCAYDQNMLNFTPYEWYAVERDLGLFRNDRLPKPVVEELKSFRKFLNGLPFETLPQRQKEAVCILTDGQDQWGVAYSTYILAKQAGFDIEFVHGDQAIKNAPLYILPSIKGLTLINRKKWLEILGRVNEGAILYVSFDQGFLSPFLEPAGIEVVSSQNRDNQAEFISDNSQIKPFSMWAARKLNVKLTSAKVLAHENDGNPIFTVNSYGKGKIYFLGFPLEMDVTRTTDAFNEDSPEYWKIYRQIGDEVVSQSRVATKEDPFVGITEHVLSPNKRVVVLVNCSPSNKNIALGLKSGWLLDDVIYGNKPVNGSVAISANDACVFQVVNPFVLNK
ncbi:MAG: cellulase family glycosylhydrolase [Mangrovibacterium sp.]